MKTSAEGSVEGLADGSVEGSPESSAKDLEESSVFGSDESLEDNPLVFALSGSVDGPPKNVVES